MDDLIDLVSIGLPLAIVPAVLVATAAGIAGVAWWIAVAFVVLVVAVVAGVCWAPRRRVSHPHAPGTPGVTVLAANVFDRNAHMAEAAAELAASDADVVVVSELSKVVHDAMAAAFPFREVLSIGGPRGHGVYSRFPLERLPEPAILGPLLHLRVQGPFTFDLLAAHLPRPTVVAKPSLGAERLAPCRAAVVALADLARSRPDVVVTGDLNLCDRQIGYRRLVAGRLDAMRTNRTAGSTFGAHSSWRWLAMRIDHLVVPPDWIVTDAREVTVCGSDHRAVQATLFRTETVV